MICPFRTGMKSEATEINDKVVITKQEEFYPECYEGKCPYYTYPDTCELANKEITEV